jgi:hypothetical protein
VRTNSKFWNASGATVEGGIFKGLRLDIDSLQTLLTGGISFVTPDLPAEPAPAGQRFVLAEKPEEEWLQWRPPLRVGQSAASPTQGWPSPRSATLQYTSGMFLKSDKTVEGWVLQTDQGLLGPAAVLCPPEDAEEELTLLRIDGTEHPWNVEPLWLHEGLALTPGDLLQDRWPLRRSRRPSEPEDVFLVTADHPEQESTPVSAARLRPDEGHWVVEPIAALQRSWHGAPVLARSDHALLGLLLWQEEELFHIVLLPPKEG